MRKLLPILLLLSPLAADICVAQTDHLNIVCSECRDPQEYPDDFVNFAFNQTYGPDAWLTYDQADDFYVTNLDNQAVYVDVDFVFLGVGFEGFRFPFWPTYILQFTLALPDGNLYTAFRSIYLTPLPVPSSDDSSQDNTTGSSDAGGGDDGEEDDYYDDYDDYDGYDEWDEQEYDDYVGFTDIEDPDEDGNFRDPDWCEEC
jgi:hypothetical protein